VSPIYDRVALIGLGLIASSMGHAMKRHGLAGEIVGHAKAPRRARRRWNWASSTGSAPPPPKRSPGADLVVLATPVGVMGAVAEEIAPHLAPGRR
jgi:cyclohexadieny/prephenate dehydrogenase